MTSKEERPSSSKPETKDDSARKKVRLMLGKPKDTSDEALRELAERMHRQFQEQRKPSS